MNTTIQYKGQLHSTESVSRICNKFKDIARTCEWDYKILDDELRELYMMKNNERPEVYENTGRLPVKGIRLNILKDYELNILFYDDFGISRNSADKIYSDYSNGNLSYITLKTKFAPKNMHITVVKLLEYLKENYYYTFEVVYESK